MTNRIKKSIWIFAGSFSLGIGVIGIFLPLLPTTPLLLLAAACYSKGSKRMHDWLLDNRWFGKYIKAYRENKDIPMKIRLTSITFLWITLGPSISLVVSLLVIRIILLLIGVGVTLHILTIGRSKES